MLRNGGSVTTASIRELNGLDVSMYVDEMDDFLGDVLADQWGAAVGSNGSVVTPTISADVNGKVRMVTGADAGGTMALNGVQLHRALNWKANQGSLFVEWRVKLSAITGIACFIGLTDQVAALECPINSAASADTLTSNATDAVGWMFDTSMATDNWWLTGVAADVDATAQNSAIAPVADTYERFRIDLSSTGVATFRRNGVAIGNVMTGALTATVALTPVVAAFSRAAASRNVDIDYCHIGALRT